MEVKGRDLVTGIPKIININRRVREAIQEQMTHRRRGQDRPGTDPAGIGRGHRGPGHLPDRRRRPAEGAGRTAQQETGLPIKIAEIPWPR